MTFLSWWQLLGCSRLIMAAVSHTWTSGVVSSLCCRLSLSEKSFLSDTLTFHGLIWLVLIAVWRSFLASFGHSYSMTISPHPSPPPPALLLQQTELRLRRPHPSPLCVWARDKEKVRGEKTPSGSDYSSDDRRGYQTWCRFFCVFVQKKNRYFA